MKGGERGRNERGREREEGMKGGERERNERGRERERGRKGICLKIETLLVQLDPIKKSIHKRHFKRLWDR